MTNIRLTKNRAFYDFLFDNYVSKGNLLIGYGIDPIKFYQSGYNLIEEIPVVVPESERFQHFGCLGTTGCGKTSMIRLMAMQDIISGKNVFIIDPKGDEDLFSTVVEAAYYAGRMDELLYISPIYPSLSLKINLLKYFMIPDELIDHIVSGVQAREQYFINVAQEVSTAIVKGLLTLSKARGEQEFQLNFAEVKRWCSYSALSDLLSSIEYLRSHSDPSIRRDADEVVTIISQILSSPQDFFAKVSSSLRTVLTALSSSTTGEIIGRATENEFIKRLETGKGVIVFCNTGSLLARRTAHIIARVVVSMIQATMGRLLAQGKTFYPPLSLYMDEGHNVLYHGITELFNKGRGAKLIIHFFTQSLAQITDAIGEDGAKSVTDNISTWVYFRVNHTESAQYIESSSPTILKKMAVHNMNDGIYEPMLRDYEDKLIMASTILHLKDRNFFLRLKGHFYRGEVVTIPDPEILIEFPQETGALSQETEEQTTEEAVHA